MVHADSTEIGVPTCGQPAPALCGLNEVDDVGLSHVSVHGTQEDAAPIGRVECRRIHKRPGCRNRKAVISALYLPPTNCERAYGLENDRRGNGNHDDDSRNKAAPNVASRPRRSLLQRRLASEARSAAFSDTRSPVVLRRLALVYGPELSNGRSTKCSN